jgi:hypothetical protein
MSAVGYELGLYIPEDGILHSHRRKPQILQVPKVCTIVYIYVER